MWKSVLSYHVGPGSRLRSTRLGRQHLYWLNHLVRTQDQGHLDPLQRMGCTWEFSASGPLGGEPEIGTGTGTGWQLTLELPHYRLPLGREVPRSWHGWSVPVSTCSATRGLRGAAGWVLWAHLSPCTRQGQGSQVHLIISWGADQSRF